MVVGNFPPDKTAQPPSLLAKALREAIIVALVTGCLTVPLLGLRLTEGVGGQSGLRLEQRWDFVGIAMCIALVGRFFLVLWWDRGWRRMPAVRLPWSGKSDVTRVMTWLLIVFVTILPFMPFADRYILDLGITVLIYIMLGWGLNVVVGLAGLLDLGYVAFYAVGAYSFALLAHYFNMSFWECLPLSGLFAALLGILLGFPVLRLRGDYLAIATLGFGEIIRIVILNWQALTGGPNGISNVPRPSFFGYELARNGVNGEKTFHQLLGIEFSTNHRLIFMYYIILFLALITSVFTVRIRRLPLGRTWEALREDEIACRALGINATNVKLSAFALGAMFGGFAGAFFATRQGFISPESFTFIESAIILAIVVLGGMGSQLGVVLAAAFLILIPEAGRDFAQYRMLIFGAAMVLVMVWRPQGLISHREPTMRMFPRAHNAKGGAR